MSTSVKVERVRRPLNIRDFESMNLPEEFWRVKVGYVQESVRPVVVRYMKKMDDMARLGAGLLLSGGPGVGKTGVAALIAKEARSLCYKVFFIGVWELREAIRSKVMYSDSVTMLDRCREVDVLILDGLREEDAQEKWFGAREIEELLANRAARKKVTILTTRLDSPTLRDKMSGVVDAAQGSMVFIPIRGENLRYGKSQELEAAIYGQAPDG